LLKAFVLIGIKRENPSLRVSLRSNHFCSEHCEDHHDTSHLKQFELLVE
jgi:hypothetical protein